MDTINYEKLIQTPCFVLDERDFQKGIEGFSAALKSFFQKSIVGYSVKTNSLPYAIKKAKDFGCVAEVVSDDELALALACGYNYSNIIFNGPMKSKKCFLESIKQGAKVNIETHRELDWLLDLPKDKIYEIGIRLNLNISLISPEDADGENDFSRFGFDDETSEFCEAIEKIKTLSHVRLVGLHIHRTTHSRSVRFYRRSVEYAAKIIQKYQLDIQYLDVGGGYFGIFRNAPTYAEYSQAIYESLSKYELEKLMIIVEPGNALTASAFTYYSSVIDMKVLKGMKVLTTDGTRNDIDPFFRKTNYMLDIIKKDDTERKIVPLQIIGGATCLEYDQLLELKDKQELFVGDVLKYNNVGAYTLTLTPMFINYFPRVYTVVDDNIKLVRDKWTAKDLMTKSIL